MAQSRARPRHTDDGHSGPSAPRIQDVARRAGVAIGTVSNVLNNPEIVTEQTRLKVEAAIAELGFVRNSAGGARRLVFLAGCPGLRLIRRRLAGAPATCTDRSYWILT